MNIVMSYNGVVTMTTKRMGKEITTKYLNSGTNTLFEAYARALAGQPINDILPTYMDLGIEIDEGGDATVRYQSAIKERIPVVVTYVSPNSLVSGSHGYDYGVPFTRVEAVLNRNMFSNANGVNTIKLLGGFKSDYAELAKITINPDIKPEELLSGTQIIIVWDLFVKNKSSQQEVVG